MSDGVTAESRRTFLEARVRARARAFDIPALVRVLQRLGYKLPDIEFSGHLTGRPQPSLVHDVVFGPPMRPDKVLVVLNLGLVSCRSPLPSYFTELLHDVDTADALRELLAFLDRKLLAERVDSFFPERSKREWPQVQRDFLDMTEFRSPAVVNSLFHHVFPELDVEVRRGGGDTMVPMSGTRIGSAVLGDCAFGTYVRAPSRGLRVTLHAWQKVSWSGIPWRVEAERRLREIVIPLLRETGMYLLVELLLYDRGKYLQLDGESSIGYEPMIGGPPGPSRVVLVDRRLIPAIVESSSAGDALRSAG